MNLNPMSPGLVVGIAFCGRPVRPEWALSLAIQNYPLNTTVMYYTMMGQEIGQARQAIAEHAVKVGAKYLWFLDDDTAPPSWAIRRLTYALSQDDSAMVCGGVYCSKTQPPEPVVFRGDGTGPFWDWKVGEVFECTGIGTGCMLIKTDVFRHLEKPWFRTIDDAAEGLMQGETPMSKYQVQDDLYFCQKVIAAGFKILADGGVLPVHWDVAAGKGFTLPENSKPMRFLAPVYPVMQQMAKELNATSYLEIGVRDGDTLATVLQASQGSLTRLVLADDWGTAYGGSGRRTHDHIDALLRDLHYTGQVEFLDGDSRETLKTLDGEFDLILLDGDHSFEGATSDLQNVWPHLRPGGVLVMDDTSHPSYAHLQGVFDQWADQHKCDVILRETSGHGTCAMRKAA